jgi:hypothetical protein
LLKDDENVGKTFADIQEHDTVQPSEPDEDKKANKDIEIDQDEKDFTTSKDHETVQDEETLKDHDSEKENIEMFVCKTLAEEKQSIDNNDREEADGISNSRKNLCKLKTNKKEHNPTETTELIPQRREVILQIDDVCESNHVLGLKREKEATKQLLEHDLIAEEDNVVIEMGTDNDGIVSILKTQFSKSIKFFLVLDSKTAKAILHLIFLKITN